MGEIKFITRNENGKLVQNLQEWRIFKQKLFNKANNQRELEFIGQLVEDLQNEYEEQLIDYEEEE